MWVVEAIKQYLEKENINYDVVELPPFLNLEEAETTTDLPAHSIVQAILLKDQYGLIMVVIPASCSINNRTLSKLFSRKFEEISYDEQKRLFKGWDPQFTPPLGNAYGIKTVIDENIISLEHVYIGAGDNTHLLKLDIKNFHQLQTNASFAKHLSVINTHEPKSTPVELTGDPRQLDPMQILGKRISECDKLPAMPEMAQRILQLNSNPYAHVADLSDVISLDPSLTAQIQRYASSPLYGFNRKIDSNTKAIQVLGYDVVMNIALGIATSQQFKISRNGALGLNEYWKHSIYSAVITSRLCKALPEGIRVQQGTIYLAALLHNFGQLLMGHLFPIEYATLREKFSTSDKPISELEMEIFGFNHGHIGSLLMEKWGLQQEVVITALEHHNDRYHGPHASYIRLVYIANQLLGKHGVAATTYDHEKLKMVLDALQLSEARADQVVEQILDDSEPFTAMAQQLTLVA
jgi:HD-like signal output (HDOD) protein/prolyl-tRNA editing enzyme YbaK/EbsC (Cys-tRNA(Pro) deacylase)